MLEISYSKKFKKHFKKIDDNEIKDELKNIISKLANSEPLEVKYKEHALKGNYKNFRECHLAPDMLLIYKIENNILYCYRLGSHSELF